MKIQHMSIIGAIALVLAFSGLAQAGPHPKAEVAKAAPQVTEADAPDAELWAVTLLVLNDRPIEADALAQIRSEIMAEHRVCKNGCNVVVAAENGRVILRGSVDSETEKRLIGKIADRIAQAGMVDNDLEVIFATASR